MPRTAGVKGKKPIGYFSGQGARKGTSRNAGYFLSLLAVKRNRRRARLEAGQKHHYTSSEK
jgi:hypothetical protein